ncbi:MAG: acyltransferase [Verrucomicrobiota bacterium]
MTSAINYTAQELQEMGIRCGDAVAVHRTVQFFNPQSIVLGHHVRIDCFCVISAGKPVVVGNHVHIAAGVSLFGGAGLEIASFAGLSARVSVFTASDDYTDGYLTNPTVPDLYKKVHQAPVAIKEHVIVGAGSVILPGVTIARGAAIGALTLVNKDVAEFNILCGNPGRVVSKRNRERLDALEADFLRASNQAPLPPAS